MSVWDDMARDAGYRGDEARQVARTIEEEERQKAEQMEPEPCPMGCGFATPEQTPERKCFEDALSAAILAVFTRENERWLAMGGSSNSGAVAIFSAFTGPYELETRDRLAREIVDELTASKQGEERWASCAECGDTGLMSALAPCTTFGSDCACNGPRIEVPCEFCGLGEGRA